MKQIIIWALATVVLPPSVFLRKMTNSVFSPKRFQTETASTSVKTATNTSVPKN
jgi:hypothetical protein